MGFDTRAEVTGKIIAAIEPLRVHHRGDALGLAGPQPVPFHFGQTGKPIAASIS